MTPTEQDDAPDLSDTHTIVDIPGFGKVWAVKNIATYYDTWLDWHNKQVLEIIGEDEVYEGNTITWAIEHRNNLRAEQRNKLKESK